MAIRWESSGNAYQYRIEGSEDEQTWSTLVDASGNKQAHAGGLVTHELDAKKTRYLRVTYLGSSGGAWGSFWEFAAFDDPEKAAQLAAAANSAETEANVESNGKSKTVRTRLVTPAGDDPLLKTMRIPDGWNATIFARPPMVNYPTFVKATPEGEVFVSVDRNGSLAREPDRGKIMKLIDTDGDGQADEFHDFVPNLDSPRGLEWDGEWLYVMHPPHLSAYRDSNGDHVADESRRLVSGIAFGFEDRPADHTSNGVTLGIDGWLYLAIGDFGFMNAEGANGTRLRFRGGGIVRVRLDGSGLHVFSRGTRNIYEVAVSPTLAAFTRDNTNDGGGWDVRFHHFTGLEHHGYPSLFRNFEEDIVQPLADYGGGSGTGALFLAEPGFPGEATSVPLTVDWGRNMIYWHEVEAEGATFREIAQHDFIAVPRPNDIDADAHGRLYVASWKDGRFKYEGEEIGFVAMVTPPNWSRSRESTPLLINSESQVGRIAAQRLLLRGEPPVPELAMRAADESAPLSSRTAALFTLAQTRGQPAYDALSRIALESKMPLKALAVRALADRPEATGHPVFKLLRTEKDPVLLRELCVAMARTGTDDSDLVHGLLVAASHDDPVVKHTAVEALAQLEAINTSFACLEDKGQYRLWPGAFRALARIHDMRVVNGIIERLEKTSSSLFRSGALKTLARLYHREGEWNGESWGTRPDTSGPYYKRVSWDGTAPIDAVLQRAMRDRRVNKTFLLRELSRNHIEFDDLNAILSMAAVTPDMEEPTVEMILRRKEPPPDSLPFLTFVATNEDRPGELRLRAATALAGSPDDMAVASAFRLTLERDQIEGIPHLRNGLKDTLLKNPTHENRYDWLLEEAHGENEDAGSLAWAILLKLTEKKALAPETREEIEKAVARASTNPIMFRRLLDAIGDIKYRKGKDIVLAASNHSDASVAKIAKKAADALKLDLDPRESTGPKIGELKPDQVLDLVMKIKGDAKWGEGLFTRTTCVACHTVSVDEPQKGPYLGNITGIYQRRELAEAILDPNKTIAQGFATNVFKLKDGNALMGFVTREAADEIEVRDVAGEVSIIKPENITERTKTEISIMPPGLVNGLTVEELASLITYLESLGK